MLIAPLFWIVVAQVPTVPLEGTVVGPAGEPVVGAELILAGLPSNKPPVVARGKSGEGGRFSLVRPAALAGENDRQHAPILWAVKPGFRASATRFPAALPKADEPVRIVLEPPGKALVRIAGPDGQPLRDVKVLPERLKTFFTTVPDVVGELASATTGPDGLAVIEAVAQDELIYVNVHSRELGRQERPIEPRLGQPAVITLRPASSWSGHLSAKDPKHARGWRVKAWTRVAEGPSGEPETIGYVETTTDDEGRFALDPIAVGDLQLDLKPPGELPVLAEVPRALSVRAGRQDAVEIALKSTVTVTGLFLERDTGKPVPGVSATLDSLFGNQKQSQTVTTDEHGRYTFQGLPGLVRIGFFRFPPTHVMAPCQGWEDLTIPEPPKVIELATREALPVAPPLHGQVVDEAGHAVPGAELEASWTLAGPRGSSNGFIRTKGDDAGRFVLEGLGPGSTVSITAQRQGRRSKSPTQVQAGGAAVVTVAPAQTPVLAVAGRVLGPSGLPVGGARINVRFRIPHTENFSGFEEGVRFEDNLEILTRPDGSFETPRELERTRRELPGDLTAEFRVEAVAEGFVTGRTVWVPAGEGDLLTLPDLFLKRARGVRAVAGRVIDRAGTPVPRAEVSQVGAGPWRTRGSVDRDGRFRLPGVSAGPALIFAEAPGFRFGGTIVEEGAGAVVIRLAREGEPPIAILKTLPPPLTRALERSLARELLEPLVSLAQSGSLGAENGSVIPALARVDPARVLAMIENRAVSEPSNTLIQVALGQFEDDPDAAIATIQDDRDPAWRAAAWLALADFRPRPDRARPDNLLERALADGAKSRKPTRGSRFWVRSPTAGWNGVKSNERGQSCSKASGSWTPGPGTVGLSESSDSPTRWLLSTCRPPWQFSSGEVGRTSRRLTPVCSTTPRDWLPSDWRASIPPPPSG